MLTIQDLIEFNQTAVSCLGPAWIAGGALRDIFHKKAVKDIDIFLPEEPTYTKRLRLWHALMGFDYSHPNGGKPLPKDTTGKLPAAWDDEKKDYDGSFIVLGPGPCWKGLPVQLIIGDFNSPTEVIADFDIELCKAYIHGAKFITSSGFQRDSLNKTITLITGKIRENDHINRVQAKYPDFRLRRA